MKAESCFHRKSCKWTNLLGATYKAVGFGRYLCAIFIQRQVRTGCQMREKLRVLRRHQTWPIGKSGFWFRNPDFGFTTKRKIKTRIWTLRNMSLDFLSFGFIGKSAENGFEKNCSQEQRSPTRKDNARRNDHDENSFANLKKMVEKEIHEIRIWISLKFTVTTELSKLKSCRNLFFKTRILKTKSRFPDRKHPLNKN